MQICQHGGAGLEPHQPGTMNTIVHRTNTQCITAHSNSQDRQACAVQTICCRHSCGLKPNTALLKPAMFLCRGQIHLTCIEAMGLATAFKHTVNGRSYLEVHHRVLGSKVLHILSLKANHPDDAASWLRDMQLGQKVCGANVESGAELMAMCLVGSACCACI